VGKKIAQLGIGHVFVMLGAHVMVFTPINGCHSKANFAWNTNDVYLGKK
jgi:hypothetical protein